MHPRPTATRRLTAGLVVASAAILLPVAALAASPRFSAPAQRTAAAPPRCGVARPALPGGAFVWSANPGDGFAGGAGYELEITNTGHHACTLRGVPAVAAVLDNGQLVGGKLPGSGHGRLITLRPGATAHVGLTVHDAGALCAHPVTANVVLYLPGQRQGQRAWMAVPACPGKPGGGVLSVSAIQAGTGIPFYDI
jgi:hypothetical protein